MNARHILTVFLMLLMLTPSMVCFMAFCPEAAQAAEKPMPCHETADKKDRSDLSKIPMLAKDCLKNDLGQTETISVPESGNGFLKLSFFIPLMLMGFQIPSHTRRWATDPPPTRRISFHRLLITQRLRQ